MGLLKDIRYNYNKSKKISELEHELSQAIAKGEEVTNSEFCNAIIRSIQRQELQYAKTVRYMVVTKDSVDLFLYGPTDYFATESGVYFKSQLGYLPLENSMDVYVLALALEKRLTDFQIQTSPMVDETYIYVAYPDYYSDSSAYSSTTCNICLNLTDAAQKRLQAAEENRRAEIQAEEKAKYRKPW